MSENVETCESCGGKLCQQCGREIVLRDRFAMAALTVLLAQYPRILPDDHSRSTMCYYIADLMMEARKK